jgi:hypothetical protein
MLIGQNFEKCVTKPIHESESLRIGLANPDSRICGVGFINHDTNQIFFESGFVITIRNESMDLQNESMFLQISYTIPASLQKIYNKGFLNQKILTMINHFSFNAF